MPRVAFAPAITGNLRGILWMLVFTLCMSSMHAAIRHVSAGLHPFEIAFFRILFGVIVVLPWFVRQGLGPLRTGRFGLMAVRGVLNAIAMLAFFFALSITPLADVTALGFTAPIFATLLAMVAFRETVGPRRWAAIAVGFTGTLVVLRPGFQEIGLGPMLVILSSLTWAVCMIIIKSLGRTESSVTITAYMSLVMAPLALVPAVLVWHWPSGEQMLWLIGIGMLGGAGQLAMAEALRVGETHAVVPVDFMKLIWISGIAYVAFSEVPGLFSWIGGAMIFGATAFIAYRERMLKAAPKPPAISTRGPCRRG